MAQTAPLPTPPHPAADPRRSRSVEAPFQFRPLVLAEHRSGGARRQGSLASSTAAHPMLAMALIVVPLFLDESLPAPDSVIRAFFAPPAGLAPPPPPPPPPPVAARRKTPRAQAAPRPVQRPEALPEFVAPITVPEEMPLDEGIRIDLGGEGVEGGIEGGVPGGVIGGIVGGLAEAPPPPKVVRVGGSIKSPALLERVDPVYPKLATAARLGGIVILEAHVDVAGRVTSVSVLRGSPLLAEAAVAAVKQWRYTPLLLNGIPTEFVLTVTVSFNLELPPRGQP